MKKSRLIPLLVILLLSLCASASAASLVGSSGPANQVYIASVTDANGANVPALTDGSTATTWTKSTSGYGADLTINLYSATVGEIWIRNGHCYSQNYYNHYDRPDVVAVTLWYPANRYTTTSVTYRYRMSDSFRPNTTSSAWNNGYQRILLPQVYSGVTKIELTVESSTQGYGRTGATITDVIVAQGSHATAAPVSRVTATPRPYVQYITPTPRVELVTPAPNPTRDVTIIVPQATQTPPLVSLITPPPRPQATATPVTPTMPVATTPPITLPTDPYPSVGVVARLTKTAATRSGPSNYYDEPGSFFEAGDQVNVVSKAWDPENELWWFQIEFSYRGEWMRAYTPENRIDLDPELVPTENDLSDSREVLFDHRVYFGPGENYRMYKVSMLYEGSKADVYAVEEIDGVLWAQIHYHDYAIGLVPQLQSAGLEVGDSKRDNTAMAPLSRKTGAPLGRSG